MNHLWAPWRMAYIANADKSEGCIFCDKPALERDEETHILHRGSRAFVMLNAFPYSNGHLMVAPNKHTADLNDLDEGELLEVMGLTRLCVNVLRRCSQPDGFNVGANMGRVAGAGVAHHVHMHIVPRWNGDTNFMAVVGGVRVVPESLDQSYARLREALAAELGR